MERQFYLLLYRAFHAQRSAVRPYGAALGLGTGQPKLIDYLARNGACSQKQLADYFEIDPSAVCRMLDALEKGGFVTRSVDKTDRRTGNISLTDRGRRAAESWQNHADAVEKQMLAGFRPEEAAQFADYLRRAYRNLKTEGAACQPSEKRPARPAGENKGGKGTQ